MSQFAKVVFLTAMFASGYAYGLDYMEYESLKKSSPGDVKQYVNGVGEGFLWMSVILDTKKQKRIYCQPEHVTLNADYYVDLIEGSLSRNRPVAIRQNVAIEIVLLTELAKKFPCQE